MGYVKKGCLHIYCGDGKGKRFLKYFTAVADNGQGKTGEFLFRLILRHGRNRRFMAIFPADSKMSGYFPCVIVGLEP